jgi:hypothetical protein
MKEEITISDLEKMVRKIKQWKYTGNERANKIKGTYKEYTLIGSKWKSEEEDYGRSRTWTDYKVALLEKRKRMFEQEETRLESEVGNLYWKIFRAYEASESNQENQRIRKFRDSLK